MRAHLPPSLTWKDFQKLYAVSLADAPPLRRRLWQLTADDLTRLCGPATLADVTDDLVTRFVRRLKAEDVDAASAKIYAATIREALKWAKARGLIAPTRPPRFIIQRKGFRHV